LKRESNTLESKLWLCRNLRTWARLRDPSYNSKPVSRSKKKTSLCVEFFPWVARIDFIDFSNIIYGY
jgi:hypothetical protein